MATPASKPNAQKKKEAAPQKDKKPKKDGVKKEQTKVAVADEKETSPQRGHAIVKSVLSGDALVLMGGSGGDGRAVEKTVFLQGVVAPRFARSRRPDDKDENWAWHSREFLRKKVIGQKVSFVVIARSGAKKDDKDDKEKADKEKGEKADKQEKGDKADKQEKGDKSAKKEKGGKKDKESGKEEKKATKAAEKPDARPPRDYCTVKLGDENLSEVMARHGWVMVKTQPARDGQPEKKPSAERQLLLNAEAAARAEKLGMWGDLTHGSPVRTIEWNPDARAIFQKFKGVPLPAIVDYVRDGSTLRCELLGLDEYDLNHTMITLHLAGIQCPSTPNQSADRDADKKEAVKPFAVEAQQFTAARLLHRDVHVVIQGVDKFNNFFGTINFAKGNITLKLLEHGLAKVLSWSAAITPDAARIKEAERFAKEKRFKIWENYTPEDEKEVQLEIQAKVVQVLSGDTLTIRIDEPAEEKTVQLASIRVPRMSGARGDLGEPFGLEAREFVRKRLIGQPVKVLIEYYKKLPPPKNGGHAKKGDKKDRERAFVSINDGRGNLSLGLLVNGLASVARHRLEEDRSKYYEAYQKAEEQAIMEKKGMYSALHHTVRPINDLTVRRTAASAVGGGAGGGAGNERNERNERRERKPKSVSQLQSKLKELQHEKTHRAIVEHVFSGYRFKLYLPDKNFMLFFALAGIKVPSSRDGPKLEPFGQKAAEIARTLILHHDVFVDFDAVDQGDNFLGSLYIHNENLSVSFLEKGYAYTVDATRNSPNAEALYAAENKAKQTKLNVWQFKEDEADKEDEEFKQETVGVKVSDVTSGHTFWFQTNNDPNFQAVEARMEEFNGEEAPAVTDFSKGVVCAGVFAQDKTWHRVRIIGRTMNEGEQRVSFIDFGNTDKMENASLKQLPEDLAAIPGAARQASLIGCWSPADTKKANNHGAKALSRLTELIYGHPVTLKLEARQESKQGPVYYATAVTDAHDDVPAINVNQDLLENGFVRLADSSKSPASIAPLIEELAQFQEAAKSAQVGVWDKSNDDEEEDAAPAGDRRNGRQKGGGGGGKKK